MTCLAAVWQALHESYYMHCVIVYMYLKLYAVIMAYMYFILSSPIRKLLVCQVLGNDIY